MNTYTCIPVNNRGIQGRDCLHNATCFFKVNSAHPHCFWLQAITDLHSVIYR